MNMRTVWKYELALQEDQVLEVPCPAKPLCVQMQRETPCLWALVEPECDESIQLRIKIAGTGNEAAVHPDAQYLGTFQVGDGAFVFHVFDVTHVED